MAKVESLGIKKVDALHYYVHDLERSRKFYTEVLDFEELGVSDARGQHHGDKEEPGEGGDPGRSRPYFFLPARRRRGADFFFASGSAPPSAVACSCAHRA